MLRAIERQGIAASICASQLEEDHRADYGYQPAIGALVDRLASKLADPCLARELSPDPDGQVACVVIEGRQSSDGTCACEGGGRGPVQSKHAPAAHEALEEDGVAEAGLDCFCEIEQLRDEELGACQSDLGTNVSIDDKPVDGWCYTDEAKVVAHCESTQRQTIRLMGEARPAPGARTFITCGKES